MNVQVLPAGKVGGEGLVRYVSVWVPDWPIVAAILAGVISPLDPVAIEGGRGMQAVSAPARARGVRVGMNRRAARSRCPQIIFLAPDPEREGQFFEVILVALEHYIARVEVMRPGLAYARVKSPAAHMAGEESLCEAIINTIADLTGVEALTGVADGVFASVIAARQGKIIPAGHTGDFLAPLSISQVRHMAVSPGQRAEIDEHLSVLSRLGIRTIGQYLAMDTGLVAARFGSLGHAVRQMIAGKVDAARIQERVLGDIRLSRHLDPPAERVELAVFAGRALAVDLIDALQQRGLACSAIEITVRTETGEELTRRWACAQDIQAGQIADRIRWQCAGWLEGRSGRAPSAPLALLELSACNLSARGSWNTPLWGGDDISQAARVRAIERAQGELGPQAVITPAPVPARTPAGRIALTVWGDVPPEQAPQDPPDPDEPWWDGIARPWPASIITPPYLIELSDENRVPVMVSGRGNISGTPRWVRGVVGQKTPSLHLRSTLGDIAERELEVINWAGPWPLCEQWWAGGERSAFIQLATSSGYCLLVARSQGQWAIAGIYD